MTVTNRGRRRGTAVVQLYLGLPSAPGPSPTTTSAEGLRDAKRLARTQRDGADRDECQSLLLLGSGATPLDRGARLLRALDGAIVPGSRAEDGARGARRLLRTRSGEAPLVLYLGFSW